VPYGVGATDPRPQKKWGIQEFCGYFQPTPSGVYAAVCEYAIVCQSNRCRRTPFPPCSQTTWGILTTAGGRYGLEPLQRGAVVRTAGGGHAELRLRLGADAELRFSTKLRSTSQKDEGTLDAAVINRVVGEVAIFSVR